MNRMIVAVIVVAALAGCSNELLNMDSKVEYEVTGSTDVVSITIANKSGGTSQYSGVTLPWSTSFKADPGDFVYVSAQNQRDTGSVTAAIYIDGDKYKRSTSTGAYVIATASGSVPD